MTPRAADPFGRFYQVSRCTGIPYAAVNARPIGGIDSLPTNGRLVYLNLCLDIPPLGAICMPAVPAAFTVSTERIPADAGDPCGVHCD